MDITMSLCVKIIEAGLDRLPKNATPQHAGRILAYLHAQLSAVIGFCHDKRFFALCRRSIDNLFPEPSYEEPLPTIKDIEALLPQLRRCSINYPPLQEAMGYVLDSLFT